MKNDIKPILLVEDTHNVRDFLEVTLKFKGFQVISVQNGEEALEKIAEGHPSLIITDILMPKLDGFALVQKLRTNPDTCNIPIIIISATYVTPEDRDFAYQLGIARFIEKPIDIENFLLTITEVLIENHTKVSDPLSQQAFLQGYRNRLETKLRYKNTQIVRIERLLTVLPENQKPSFQSMLDESTRDRQVIQEELDQINQLQE
jgi:DNA-binding response OmpR family regulator